MTELAIFIIRVLNRAMIILAPLLGALLAAGLLAITTAGTRPREPESVEESVRRLMEKYWRH